MNRIHDYILKQTLLCNSGEMLLGLPEKNTRPSLSRLGKRVFWQYHQRSDLCRVGSLGLLQEKRQCGASSTNLSKEFT